MQAQWIFSSTFLPFTGEPIDFMVEDRVQPIHGTFVDGSFHSRWADYDPGRVKSWRGSKDDRPGDAIEAPTKARASRMASMLKRLFGGLTTRHQAAKAAPVSSHRRRVVTPVNAALARISPARRVDSNQQSS